MNELALKLARAGNPRIVVVGDAFVDRDIQVTCTRLSQEAPGVPIYTREKDLEPRAGGAAAVDKMCQGLGAITTLFSNPRREIKDRIFIGDKQVGRIDTLAKPLTEFESTRMAQAIADEVTRAQCVLVQDHGKGTCTDAVIEAAIGGAKAASIQCIVDPAHGASWLKYRGAIIKCNALEARNGAYSHAIVTNGENGIEIRTPESCDSFPAKSRRAIDPTGCGDAVLAALGFCVSTGFTARDGCTVANSMAGLKVERRGAVPITKSEIIADLIEDKIIPDELLVHVSNAARLKGTVVWLNGCFDGLHRGHLYALEEAKRQGSTLIVGVNEDESVRSLKGPGRPINGIENRLAAIASTRFADYVVSFRSEMHLEKCLRAVMPDVYVKDENYKGQEKTGVQYAVKVHYCKRLPGFSTSAQLVNVTGDNHGQEG